ncbi:MAG TPA: 4Fe-4S dicluster domain-containing protein [Patescibacteria group bacterium]|nr:4Fe-4S dicluster domain-containing protein [Patescibacteria group bacterium]
MYYIEVSALDNFAQALCKSYAVFSPFAKDPRSPGTDYSYARLSENTPSVFNPYRCIEPLKAFFTHPLQKVAGYFGNDDQAALSEKTVIFGVKACDIAGHKIQDFVFLEGVDVDAAYAFKREQTILIAGDCTDFKDVCHCLAWDILPHPLEGFDLSLSPLNDGFLVEVGSKKGQELIEAHPSYFTPAKESQISVRRVKREGLQERLKRHLFPQNLVPKDSVQALMRQGYNVDTWHQFMLTCVECGGCNFICDTCHCFLLNDKPQGQVNSRLRLWDSCQYANYARVAGGANPLKTRTQRLRFRFTKKFDFFVDNLGMPACCGCGRCIEVCPGKIDIREVLKDVAKKVAAAKT